MKSLFFLVSFYISNALAGGHSVGNGGVIWSCADRVNGATFYRGVLTDLFEAKEQYKWNLIADPGGDPIDLYNQRKAWLEQSLPKMYEALKTRFAYVEEHQTFVNAELESTKDFNNAIKPLASSCPEGLWTPVNIANFREEDQQVLISQNLWQSPYLATLDKAALLFHEAVYYWMRTYYGSTNSDKSRKITGLLFTTLSAEEMKTEIRKILGTYPDQPDGRFICVMKNTKRNQIYVAYGPDEQEASLTVRMRCQDDLDAGWCARTSLSCEEVVEQERRQCISENLATHKIYVGKGRVLIEAQFNAHMACFIGSQAFGENLEQQCPDFNFLECN